MSPITLIEKLALDLLVVDCLGLCKNLLVSSLTNVTDAGTSRAKADHFLHHPWPL